MSKFSAKDYNFVAKRIREIYPVGGYGKSNSNMQRRILEELARNCAKKYAEDNEFFDPVRFLDACSPDPEKYPLSELFPYTNDETGLDDFDQPIDVELYDIVRFRFKGENEAIERGVTLEEAQEHCNREDTHGEGWFDGYRDHEK